MLTTEGKPIIRNTYPIDRDYENLEERLRGLGADITKIEQGVDSGTLKKQKLLLIILDKINFSYKIKTSDKPKWGGEEKIMKVKRGSVKFYFQCKVKRKGLGGFKNVVYFREEGAPSTAEEEVTMMTSMDGEPMLAGDSGSPTVQIGISKKRLFFGMSFGFKKCGYIIEDVKEELSVQTGRIDEEVFVSEEEETDIRGFVEEITEGDVWIGGGKTKILVVHEEGGHRYGIMFS